MAARLILYDTCNFRDFPVGGQITSIKNFLRFLQETCPQHTKDVLLVGVSTDPEEVGKIKTIETVGGKFSFLAVTEAAAQLDKVKKSLRLEYVKGLLRYRRLLGLKKEDCNYIHTPEAFGVVRILRPGAVCYVFSHGSYMNMWQKLRFFQKQVWIRKAFQKFLEHVIKSADCNLVLDEKTKKEYEQYSKNVVKAGNSICVQSYREKKIEEGMDVEVLYAGRLSDGKNLGPVISAIKNSPGKFHFTILGDGESRQELESLAAGDGKITFAGAVEPEKVGDYMKKSHILIMNSKYEGIPMCILEGLSYGLPVVTTNVGGIGEVLKFGVDSEETDGTPEKISQALEKVVKNYRNYSEAAYKSSLAFDYRKVNEKVLQVLNRKLGWQ